MVSMRQLAYAAAWLVITAHTAFAQAGAVTGRVVDARTGVPLAKVMVFVENTTLTTETGDAGTFSLTVAPGRHRVNAFVIGYALSSQDVDVAPHATLELTIRLGEGAGVFEEHVTVAGDAAAPANAVAAGATIHGRDLLNLRGVTLDDPLRAVQSLPSVNATDDFYSEFAVRGQPFRTVGLTIDGIPSRYLMHTVHGVTDGGSIAMVNAETLGAVTLWPGSYPQKGSRQIGAQLDLSTREGNRDRLHGRGGFSGTSAGLVLEGPLARGQGSWLVSARKSYLDVLIKQIDPDGGFAFGFTDTQAKLVYDVNPRHQLQLLAIAGRSDFHDDPAGLGLNEEASTNALGWLTSVGWRYAGGPRFVMSHRLYATGVDFANRNRSGDHLDQGTFVDLGWRGNASLAWSRAVTLELGAEAQHLTGERTTARALNDQPRLTQLNAFSDRGHAAAAFAEVTWKPAAWLALTPGVRIDHYGVTGDAAATPWLNGEVRAGQRTSIRFGAGRYEQFPTFDHLRGMRSGGEDVRSERAEHVDVGVQQRLPGSGVVQATWFARHERDGLWAPDAEPRRRDDGSLQPGRGDAPWLNDLSGEARGVELLYRRDVATGLSGWLGYAYSRHKYTSATTGETFWADADQRHTLSAYASLRVSNRSTLSSRFRFGSNYPITGYVGAAPPASDQPPLFGGGRPLFHTLTSTRNTLRLPAYARWDIRADRAFRWSAKRVTVFAEVANILNRGNVRNVPYDIDRSGRVSGATDRLWPILPSGGVIIEF